MKKILLLIIGVLAIAFPETVSASHTIMVAAESDFPVIPSSTSVTSAATFNYYLIHPENAENSSPTFYGITYGNPTTVEAVQKAVTRQAKGVFTVGNTDFERLRIQKSGSDYILKFKQSSNNCFFSGITDEGAILTRGVETAAAKVQVKFEYGKNGTIHYEGKELQLIDGKILFAEPTTDITRKLYLFIDKDNNAPTYYGVQSTTLSLTPSGTNVINTDQHSFTIKASHTQAGTPSIVADGEQPSSDYRISGNILTIFKGAAPGKYKFTAYVYNYTYEGSRSVTITVKEDLEYVWVYGQAYDPGAPAFDENKSEVVESSIYDRFEVNWNPGLKYFNVAARNKTTGAITLVNPREIESLRNLTPSSYPNPAIAATPVSEGFYFSAENSGNASTEYPLRPALDATSRPDYTLTVPTLYLTVNAMRPDYNLSGNTAFAWSQDDGTYTLHLSAPGVELGDASQVFYTATLEPAQEFVTTEGTDLPDGNYTDGRATVQPVIFPEGTTDFSTAELTISGLPCSGLYNLVVKYNNSSRPYIDGAFEARLPVEIYPSSTGLELGLVNKEGNIFYTGPVREGTWTGPKDVTSNSVYRSVQLTSTTTAGISAYYKAGGAQTDETATAVSTRVSVPEGYTFTSAAEHQYMDLSNADALTLYVAKNGAIAPSPVSITVAKTGPIVSGTDVIDLNPGADVPAEYFTNEGIRVAAPIEGNIYIVRRGSSVSKLIYSEGK